MNKTGIEWTNFSANPLKYRTVDGTVVWGCVHTSEGCRHCYSEALAHRYGRGGPFTAETMKGLTPFLDEKELRSMLTYKPASGKMCFVGDMTDLFGEWVPFELLDKLFAVFALRQDVTWQILTKRPERLREYISTPDRAVQVATSFVGHLIPQRPTWPLSNCWVGCSVEDQTTAAKRIPELLQTPAAVRFISAEPLLGHLNICRWIPADWSPTLMTWKYSPVKLKPTLDWVIVGGESGGNSRECHPHWIRNIVGPCLAAMVPVFVKQLGSNVIGRNDDGFDGNDGIHWPAHLLEENRIEDLDTGYQGAPVRIRLKDRKGGDPLEWPEDLRVREFPS